MAKKRKSKKTTRRRSRRVSGIGDSLMPILGGAAGAVAGKVLTGMLSGSVDGKILNIGKIGVALFLPSMIKGQFGSALAIGLGGAGVAGLLSDVGVIKGFYDLPTVGAVRRVAGRTQPLISGSAQQVLNGVADVRSVRPSNTNPVLQTSQLSVISGIESELDGAAYN